MGVMDYIDKPAEFVARVAGMTRAAACFSCPIDGGPLAWQRKLRYKSRCPLYMYTEAGLKELLDSVVQDCPVHVANRHDPHAWDLSKPADELAPPAAHASDDVDPAESDHGHSDLVVGPRGVGEPSTAEGQARQTKRQPTGQRSLQEVPASCPVHLLAPR